LGDPLYNMPTRSQVAAARIRSMRNADLYAMLQQIVPRMEELAAIKSREELVKMGLLKLKEEPQKVWGIVAERKKPEGTLGTDGWIKTVSVEERVQGEVSAVQANQYMRIVNRILGSTRKRNLTDSQMMALMAFEKNIRDSHPEMHWD
jgi:hypothetical protein